MAGHQPATAMRPTESHGNVIYFQGAAVPFPQDDYDFDPLADGRLGPSQNVNLEEENFQWLQMAAASTGWRGGSTVARKAIKFFRLFFAHHKKLIRYRKTVLAMLNTLP